MAKKKKWKQTYPVAPTANYQSFLNSENKRMMEATATFIYPALEGSVESRMDSTRLDIFNFLQGILDGIRKAKEFFYTERIPEGQEASLRNYLPWLRKNTRRQEVIINNFSKKTFDKNMDTVLGVDPKKGEPYLVPMKNIFIKRNVGLIKTIPSEYFGDIEKIIDERVSRGDSSGKIKNDIQDRFGVSENQAKLIARDQTNKYASSLDHERTKNNGMTRYVWHNADSSSRVRPDHKKLDGETFEYSKPPVTVTTGKRSGETNNPGLDIQCRCWAEPIFDDLFEGD